MKISSSNAHCSEKDAIVKLKKRMIIFFYIRSWMKARKIIIHFFMSRDWRSGAYYFCLVCYSLILSLLLITYEHWVLELWYLTWVFLVTRLFRVNHTFFTLCPWPWSFTYFLKTLTLLITFEQWELEHWYFT